MYLGEVLQAYKNKLYMFNKLTSLEEKTMKLKGLWKIPSGVLWFREIPMGSSSGQRELAQDLLVLTALGPQFRKAKGCDRKEREKGRV